MDGVKPNYKQTLGAAAVVIVVGVSAVAGLFKVVAQGIENWESYNAANSNEFTGPVSTFNTPAANPNHQGNPDSEVSKLLETLEAPNGPPGMK